MVATKSLHLQLFGASSPFTISIGATDDQGNATWYSEQGPNLIVCAPSNGANRQGITTTNNTGYRDNFGGTSSATPLRLRHRCPDASGQACAGLA